MDNHRLEPYNKKSFYKENAYLRAEKRVKELKGFYWHVFWYAVVNLFIIIMIAKDSNNIWNFGTFSTAFFWGIGLGFHALSVFGKNLVFSKDWEDRKIREYMEDENKHTFKPMQTNQHHNEQPQ